MHSQILLRSYCVPSMVIGTECPVMNKRGKDLALLELLFWKGRESIKM